MSPFLFVVMVIRGVERLPRCSFLRQSVGLWYACAQPGGRCLSAGTLTPHHTVMEQSFVQSADTVNGHRKRIREAVRITGLVLTSVGITGLVLRSVRIAGRVLTAVGIVT